MKLIITENYEELSRVGADMMAEIIAARPDATMVLATGSTPMGVYSELAKRKEAGQLDAARLRVFQLDEYLGVPSGDPRSLYDWMVRSFVAPLGVPESNVVRLLAVSPDPNAACEAYDRAVLETGGFELSVLGLGPNGHLGFNEPPSDPSLHTRVIDLTEESIESNARYWGGRDMVPRQALTAGMSQLMAARQTLLVVSGTHKQEILRRTIQGPVTPEVPASFLQRAANVTVLADRDAWPLGPLDS
jgi:glucosamine-6-phosphate deaminase